MPLQILCTVLAAIGIFLAVLIGLILFVALILIFCKVCVIIRYDNQQFFLAVKILFLTIPIYPRKEKKKKKEKDRLKKEKKSAPPKKQNRFVQKAKRLDLSDYLEIAGIVLERIVKKIYFERLHLSIIVAGPDAAQTAITYGKINAAVYPLASMIHNHKQFHDLTIHISPDFMAEKTVYTADIMFYTRICHLLYGLFGIAGYFM